MDRRLATVQAVFLTAFVGAQRERRSEVNRGWPHLSDPFTCEIHPDLHRLSLIAQLLLRGSVKAAAAP